MKKITEELCGYRFSASTISNIVKRLDAQLLAFARRRLDEPFPYVIVDARYEKVRDNGVIASQAVLIALGIDGEGRRQVLAVELANRESTSSWKGFLLSLKERGLSGVEFVVSDDHPGLKKAIAEVLPEAAMAALLRALSQKCPGPHAEKTRRRLPAGTALALRPPRYRRGAARSGGLADALAGQIPHAHRLGRGQHRGDPGVSTGCRANTTNTSSRPTCWKRYNQEIQAAHPHRARLSQRSRAAVRLIRALAVETHEDWLEANRYINMKLLTEHKRELMKQAA